MPSKPTTAKIREAAAMSHTGATFREIAEAMGRAVSTVHGWQKSDVWQETIADLEEADRRAYAKQYRESLAKHQKKLEIIGSSGLDISAKVLGKLSRAVDRVNPDDADSIRDILDLISRLSSSFEKLTNARTLYVEGAGVESVIRQLDELEDKK